MSPVRPVPVSTTPQVTPDTIAYLSPSPTSPAAISLLSTNPHFQTPLSSTTPHLELRFSHAPKSTRGYLLGSDPHLCDLVLPRLRGVSRTHCFLTFNSWNELVLTDCSKRGTKVWTESVDDESETISYRRGASWVLATPGDFLVGALKAGLSQPSEVPTRLTVTTHIEIQNLHFLLHIPAPASLPLYISKISAFLTRLRLPLVLFPEAAWSDVNLFTEVLEDNHLVQTREDTVTPEPESELVTETLPDAARNGLGDLDLAGPGLVAEDDEPGTEYLKYSCHDATFLWNQSRPWEPVITVLE